MCFSSVDTSVDTLSSIQRHCFRDESGICGTEVLGSCNAEDINSWAAPNRRLETQAW